MRCVLQKKFEKFMLTKIISLFPMTLQLFLPLSLSRTLLKFCLIDRAFSDDSNLQCQSRNKPRKLLEIATTNQLFQFNGDLYEQTDVVVMPPPLGHLITNVFICYLETKLERDGFAEHGSCMHSIFLLSGMI